MWQYVNVVRVLVAEMKPHLVFLSIYKVFRLYLAILGMVTHFRNGGLPLPKTAAIPAGAIPNSEWRGTGMEPFGMEGNPPGKQPVNCWLTVNN